MSKDIDETLCRKIRTMLDLISAGAIQPSPEKLVWAAGILKAHGEVKLARECEAVARRLLPNLQRDLT